MSSAQAGVAGVCLPLPVVSHYPACTTGRHQKDHRPPWLETGCCCPLIAQGSASASSRLAHEFLLRHDTHTERNFRHTILFFFVFCVYVCLSYFPHCDKTPCMVTVAYRGPNLYGLIILGVGVGVVRSHDIREKAWQQDFESPETT